MTDYTTQEDVQNNLKGVTISDSTEITTAALSDFISEESAFIDGYISQRYDLPISNASALLFLKKICNALVVYRVKTVLQPQTALPTSDSNINQDIVGTAPYKNAVSVLEQIKDGDFSLPGEDEASETLFSSSDYDEDYPTVFVAKDEQW